MFRRIMFVAIILVGIYSFSFAGWQDFLGGNSKQGISLPPSTEKISSSVSNIVGQNMTVSMYVAPLSFEEIKNFYRRILTSEGWEEKSAPTNQIAGQSIQSQQNAVVFTKNNNSEYINIIYIPRRDPEGRTYFAIGQGKAPTLKDFANTAPAKLDFMPLYPAAKQISFKEDAEEISVSYVSQDKMSSIINFYKMNMPDYNWELSGEDEIERSSAQPDDLKRRLAFCPNCPKDASSLQTMERESGGLEFTNKYGDICRISLTYIKPTNTAEQAKPEDLKESGGIDLSSAVTLIAVGYQRSENK